MEPGQSKSNTPIIVIGLLFVGLISAFIAISTFDQAEKGNPSNFVAVTDSTISNRACLTARANFAVENKEYEVIKYDSCQTYWTIDRKSGDTTTLNAVLYFGYKTDSALVVYYFMNKDSEIKSRQEYVQLAKR